MVGPFRSPKTRSWDATTLEVSWSETIAGEHGYQAKIDPQLGAIPIPHIWIRPPESDMALLTRLAAKRLMPVAKPVAGFLVLAAKGRQDHHRRCQRSTSQRVISQAGATDLRPASLAGAGSIDDRDAKPPTTPPAVPRLIGGTLKASAEE